MSIKFFSRGEIFEQSALLARHIYDWQEASFNAQDNYVEAGEDVWLDIDDAAPTTLTAEQAAQFNASQDDYCQALRDEFAVAPAKLSSSRLIIAELSAASFETFVQMIGERLQRLFEAMGYEEIFVLSDSKTPYLEQENDFPDVKAAEEKLMALGLTRDFSGGIGLPPTSVPELFSALFWIARCNASAPYILFSGKGALSIGTLCKYGNIHFDVYDEAEQTRLETVLIESGFHIAEDGVCVEKFSETSAITGRRIQID